MDKIDYFDGDQICAFHLKGQSFDPGLNFYSRESDFIQIGTWNYNQGKELQPHMHNFLERLVTLTQEVLFVKCGKIKVNLYSSHKKLIHELEVHSGEIMVLLGSGHGYEVIENNTQVLEIKNGPYFGAELDRERL